MGGVFIMKLALTNEGWVGKSLKCRSLQVQYRFPSKAGKICIAFGKLAVICIQANIYKKWISGLINPVCIIIMYNLYITCNSWIARLLLGRASSSGIQKQAGLNQWNIWSYIYFINLLSVSNYKENHWLHWEFRACGEDQCGAKENS